MSSSLTYSKPVPGSNQYIEQKFRSRVELSAWILKLSLNHILYPEEKKYKHYSNDKIYEAWIDWKLEVKAYNLMTYQKSIVNPAQITFPTPPPDNIEYLPCRKMWALLILDQVFGYDHIKQDQINGVVKEIMSCIYCITHPSICHCKIPYLFKKEPIKPMKKVSFTFYN